MRLLAAAIILVFAVVPANAAKTPPAEAGTVALARSQYAAAVASGSMRDACAAATVVADWASRHSGEPGVEREYHQWHGRQLLTCSEARGSK